MQYYTQYIYTKNFKLSTIFLLRYLCTSIGVYKFVHRCEIMYLYIAASVCLLECPLLVTTECTLLTNLT